MEISRTIGRQVAIAGVFAAIAFAVVPAVSAQQVVETSTGKRIAGHQCSISQAMLAEIQGAGADRKAETRAKLEALLDSALASPKTRQTAQSSVVFPPAR